MIISEIFRATFFMPRPLRMTSKALASVTLEVVLKTSEVAKMLKLTRRTDLDARTSKLVRFALANGMVCTKKMISKSHLNFNRSCRKILRPTFDSNIKINSVEKSVIQ
ncbi:MAG: hypothetical protein XD58_1528 [Thermotoga sp. 50_1627]|nr:MAG: hypothetical protein XD45_1513 [Thermotoga sp. 50_64]KUK24479.1 MAG: hypothetical protein XD58_1528 [Thermotoga sp. 50_1627]MDK2923948.1 hypothetical protein [Pseudothermotoga sp.]